jgi:competence protein ComEC
MKNPNVVTLSAHRFTLRSRLMACAVVLLFCIAVLNSAHAQKKSARNLLIYSLDADGGQMTLIVAPSGASMLVDAGWPDRDGRYFERLQTAMKDAGITRIDHVLITHYHVDHVGGVPDLVKHVEVGEFIDHGENREDTNQGRDGYAAYLKAIDGKPHRVVKPGDSILIPGLKVLVVAADGEHISAVPGIKPQPNPFCASEQKWEVDTTENARSAGFLLTFGKFRFLDLGDLTGAKEVEMVCPSNPLGTVDLYLVSHHGMDWSNSRSLVHAIHPRVAIMNNGSRKAGSPAAWQIVHDSPGIEDLYMVHTAEGSDAAHNSAETLIANPKGSKPDGAYFKVVASANGGFSVTNTRTGSTKEYTHK